MAGLADPRLNPVTQEELLAEDAPWSVSPSPRERTRPPLSASRRSSFFPAARRQIPLVKTLVGDATFDTKGTNGFHFDDLFSYDRIAARWQALEAWVQTKAQALERDGWGAGARTRFLCLLGIVHHAVQDFYAHSNWAKLLNPSTKGKRFDPAELPTWDELPADGNWPGRDQNVPGQDVIDRLKRSNANPESPTEDGPNDGLQTGAYEQEGLSRSARASRGRRSSSASSARSAGPTS